MAMSNEQKTAMLKRNVQKAMSLAPDAPWNQTTPEELGPCLTAFIETHEPYFRRWAETWYMTMQYVFGQHNFRWSRRNGFAVDFDWTRQKQQPSSYVRAYTNIARIAIESLTSGLYSNTPAWDVEAIDDSATAGRRQKKICGSLLNGLFETLTCDKDAAAAAFVFGMFGQFAFDSSWNPMSGRVIEQPRMVKANKPAYTSWMANNPLIPNGLIETPTAITDAQGRPYMDTNWQVARDVRGREIIDRVFTGNPQLSVKTPFEYRRSIGSTGMHNTRYVQIFELMDYDQWLDMYGQVPGKTKFFDEIEPVYSHQSVYQFAMRFYMRMLFVTPPSDYDVGSRWGASMVSGLKHKVLVVKHYDEPHPLKWPEGRLVVVANGRCTHITKPQYNTKKLDGWHPLSEAQWLNAYPSSIASGPMQDLVKKNQELNVMDSFIATAMRRSLGGQYLIKIGSGIDPNRLVGEPGVAHEVTDPYGIRILHDELAIPPVVAQIRKMQMDDAYMQAGALESQRGESGGETSGYQTKLVEEREDKRLAPARKAFRNAMASAGEKLIYALQANVILLDDALMGYLMANAAGEFTAQDVVSFMSQPLGIGTKIKIVENSMIYRSGASIKAEMSEMANNNPAVQQRLATDAKLLDRYLKFFNMETLRDRSATQRDRAERENENFLDMAQLGKDTEGLLKPVVIFEDDDQIHIDEHTDFIVKYWELVRTNREFLLEFYTHLETHRLQQEEKQAKLMPGTSLNTGAMVQMAANQPKPAAQQILMDAKMRQMQAPAEAQAQDPKQAGTPNGAAPTSTGTPAAKTQAGQQQASQGG